MARCTYDIVIIGDLRLPGATARAVAEEIRAQARGGYRTALLQLQSPLLERPKLINPLIRAAIDEGLADLVDPEVPIAARLALAHHPALFLHLPARIPRIQADCKLLILNHPLLDAEGGSYFPAERVAWSAQEVLGRDVRTAPGGPQIRAQFAQAPWQLDLHEHDWPPVLEPDQFTVDAQRWHHNPITIGRHGPNDALAWPEDRADLLAAYPNGAGIAVRIMGSAIELQRRFGEAIRTWSIVDPETLAARDFLTQIDAYVCFTATRTVQPVRLEIAEALMSGSPAVLPVHFQTTFGDGAIYSEPETVSSTIARLRADPELRLEQAERGRAIVTGSFSHDAHLRRVRELIGPPSGDRHLVLRRERLPTRRVLFFSSNGVGMGHLTRLLAIARRCSGPIEPVFLSMSQAAAVVEEFGYLVEFTAHHNYLDLDVERWNAALRGQLNETIEFYDIKAVLFDGNVPYRGLIDARLDHPSVPFLWCRRGMWRPGAGRNSVDRRSHFDAIIEPRDIAESYDRGLTSYWRERTFSVEPILLHERNELLSRDAARAELGLDPDRPALLVQLGSGNNYDYSEALRLACAHAEQRNVQLAVAEWLISEAEGSALPGDALQLRTYPLSRYINAFDGAISAVGYNSFHELIAYAVPAIFIPNEHPTMDDQLMRAQFAERRGLGLCVRTCEPYRLRAAIDRVLDPDHCDGIVSRCRALAFGNGAEAAARLIEEMAIGIRANRPLSWEAEFVRRI
jgi:UDP:flavonoid glycosyltransferase YjiC (YdhE family)